MLLVISTERKLLERSTKKNCKSLEKAVNYMLNGKDAIIRLIARWIKRHNMNDPFFSRTNIIRRKSAN